MKPIAWQKIIEIYRQNKWRSGLSDNEIASYYRRTEDFLSFLQTTKTGQAIFRGIEKKLKNERLNDQLRVVVTDCVLSQGGASDIVFVNALGEQYLAFIDQQTNKPKSVVFESILLHELVHAADPRIKKGFGTRGENLRTLVEHYAVARTDNFARRHRPEWGIMGCYENIAGSIADRLLDIKTEDGNALLRESADLRNEIAENVRTAPQRIREAHRQLRLTHAERHAADADPDKGKKR